MIAYSNDGLLIIENSYGHFRIHSDHNLAVLSQNLSSKELDDVTPVEETQMDRRIDCQNSGHWSCVQGMVLRLQRYQRLVRAPL